MNIEDYGEEIANIEKLTHLVPGESNHKREVVKVVVEHENTEEKKSKSFKMVQKPMIPAELANSLQAYFAKTFSQQSEKKSDGPEPSKSKELNLPKDYKLKLNLSEDLDLKRLDSLKDLSIPEISSCTISYVEKPDNRLLQLLQKSLKKPMEGFYFNYPAREEFWVKKLDFSPFASKSLSHFRSHT